MSVSNSGDSLLDLLRGATSRVVVAAPYIKVHALRRLISALPVSISSFVCVTRWLPEDIASGMCDLEILDAVANVRGGVLLVHPHLHAKYYAAGSGCLVGSANLTGRGLGWHISPNVELLVALPSEFPGLREWEAMLISSAVRATPMLRDQIRKEAESLKVVSTRPGLPEVEEDGGEDASALWVPGCSVPERLWLVYQGRGTGQMVDRLASAGLTDSQALQFFAERLPPSSDTPHDQQWRILKLWLVHFLPTVYRVEVGQEVLIKGKELPRR